MLKRGESATEGVAVKGLQRITAQEDRLRREKVALLRQELTKVREKARLIEHELRSLGDPDAMRTVGWVNWEAVYDELPARFSAREVAARTGVQPSHVASVTHRWRREGRIARTERGRYKKTTKLRGERKPHGKARHE